MYRFSTEIENGIRILASRLLSSYHQDPLHQRGSCWKGLVDSIAAINTQRYPLDERGPRRREEQGCVRDFPRRPHPPHRCHGQRRVVGGEVLGHGSGDQPWADAVYPDVVRRVLETSAGWGLLLWASGVRCREVRPTSIASLFVRLTMAAFDAEYAAI